MAVQEDPHTEDLAVTEHVPVLVTLDGGRGTGKSWAASALRSRFGCAVVELGPLFRMAAWLSRRLGNAQCLLATLDLMSHLLEVGHLKVDVDCGTDFTAMSVLYYNTRLGVELWEPLLDSDVKAFASDPVSVAWVRSLAASLTTGRNAIVVGRDAGSRFFPDAGLKFELRAQDQVRRLRKAEQVGTDMDIDRSEPVAIWPTLEGTIVIDTTASVREEVVAMLSKVIVQRLGWSVSR